MLKNKIILTIIFAIFSFNYASVSGSSTLSIDHAYLRKLTSYDTGTIHMFLRNESSKKITIKNVILDGIPLPSLGIVGINLSQDLLSDLSLPAPVQQEDERIVWYRVFPNPIPPGKVADIQIKWAYPPYKLIRVTVETNRGKKLSQVIQPVNNPLCLSYVGFNRSFNKLYIYLESTYKEKLEIIQILLDSEDVTGFAFKPWRYIQPNEKRCIQLNLSNPLNKGEYISVKIVTKEGIIAQSLVRVSSFFPITTYRGFRPDFNLDAGDYRIHCRDSLNLFVKKNLSVEKMCHILDCPTHAHGNYRNAARKAIARAGVCCQEGAPFYPTSMYICKAVQERGSFLFGEIADIVISNTAEPYSFWKHTGEENPTQRTALIMKQGSSPHPFHALPITGFDGRFLEFKNRLLTPEEERLIVYYNISRGAKGIFYYFPSWGRGNEAERTKLRREIKAINTGLRLLKPFLITGEYIPLAETDEPMVNTSTIVSGYEAIILILINGDYQSKPEKGTNAFSYKPRGKFDVTVAIPEGMKIKGVNELIAGMFLPIKYHYTKEKVTIPVDGLDITKVILLDGAPD